MRGMMTCALWAAMVLAATASCDKESPPTSRAASAPGPPSGPAPIPAFVIADVTPVGEVFTETRVRVHFCEESRDELVMEGDEPPYQMEYRLPSDRESQSMLIQAGTALAIRITIEDMRCDYFTMPSGGGMRFSPPTASTPAPRQGEFLLWAAGAVHEYSGSTVKRPQERLWHAQGVRPLEFETKDGMKYYRLCNAAASPVWGALVCVSSRPLHGWRVVSSNPAFPLTFAVVKRKGYVYMYGEGVIEDTQGRQQKLGPVPLKSWIAALGSPDPLLRQSAAMAIGWLGKDDAQTLNALENAASDSEPLVRRSVAEALGRLKLTGATAVLRRLASDGHDWTNVTARLALNGLDRQEQKP